MKRLLILSLFALFLVPVLASADSDDLNRSVNLYREKGYTVTSIAPIFGQLVAMGSPQGFANAFERTNGQSYTHEWVPEGENVNQWTQMITVTGAKGLASNPNASPRKFTEGIAGGFNKACPKSFSAAALFETKISGYDAFAAVVGCGTSPTQGGPKSEVALIIAIKGESDYYTIQWAERATPSDTALAIDPKKWMERFGKLTPIKLCPIIPGEAAPYPSCVGGK